MDIYTHAHKSAPFVNGKLYPLMCFTCFFVPKIEEQKYDRHGSISEEIELPYCCENISDPRDLYEQGVAESLSRAKTSVNAVKSACAGVKKPKKPIFRPTPTWNIC